MNTIRKEKSVFPSATRNDQFKIVLLLLFSHSGGFQWSLNTMIVLIPVGKRREGRDACCFKKEAEGVWRV